MKNGKKNRQTLFMYYVQQSVLGFDEFFQTLFKSMKRTAKKSSNLVYVCIVVKVCDGFYKVMV